MSDTLTDDELGALRRAAEAAADKEYSQLERIGFSQAVAADVPRLLAERERLLSRVANAETAHVWERERAERRAKAADYANEKVTEYVNLWRQETERANRAEAALAAERAAHQATREALRLHGGHHTYCDKGKPYSPNWSGEMDPKCTCGWDEAEAALSALPPGTVATAGSGE
jgi:alkylation response protein AidB-like acyl-CoA dehydrogenase